MGKEKEVYTTGTLPSRRLNLRSIGTIAPAQKHSKCRAENLHGWCLEIPDQCIYQIVKLNDFEVTEDIVKAHSQPLH